MKAAAARVSKYTGDFYMSTIAPVHQQTKTRFGIVDITMLTVLIVETAFFVRLTLAN
jgi:hypothetical protein